MKLEKLSFDIKKGDKIQIEGGYDLGLDAPKGEILVLAIDSLSNNPKLKEDVRIYLSAAFPTIEDLMRETGEYMRQQMEELTNLVAGDWITFMYIDGELNDLYEKIVIPYADFIKLIEKK